MAKFTREDIENAKLIGVLMIIAMLLKSLVKHKNSGEEAAAKNAADRYGELIYQVMTLYGGDPEQLEREVIRMAKHLGISIEVCELSSRVN